MGCHCKQGGNCGIQREGRKLVLGSKQVVPSIGENETVQLRNDVCAAYDLRFQTF
jgi:hypothetical protein